MTQVELNKEISNVLWYGILDLQELNYQLKLNEQLLYVEKKQKGNHISFFEEKIRRYKEDIKYLSRIK